MKKNLKKCLLFMNNMSCIITDNDILYLYIYMYNLCLYLSSSSLSMFGFKNHGEFNWQWSCSSQKCIQKTLVNGGVGSILMKSFLNTEFD